MSSTEHMATWDVEDVLDFVGSVDETHRDAFERHKVTGATLQELTYKDMVMMGVPNGPAVSIRRAVQKYLKAHPPNEAGLLSWLWSALPAFSSDSSPHPAPTAPRGANTTSATTTTTTTTTTQSLSRLKKDD